MSKKCMCEEDIINDILMSEKNISNNYSTIINEMSNKYLYKIVLGIFTDTKNMARELYNLAYEKGWYTVESEKEEEIDKTFHEYSEKLKNMC